MLLPPLPKGPKFEPCIEGTLSFSAANNSRGVAASAMEDAAVSVDDTMSVNDTTLPKVKPALRLAFLVLK